MTIPDPGPGSPAPGPPAAASPEVASPTAAATAAAPAVGRPPTTADKLWTALAAELTPAASLARVDAATVRVVTSITVIGTLLTGLGVLGAASSSVHGFARTLVAVAVGLSALSVVTALAAQVLTISRALRPGNLLEVKAWYRNVFARRARLAQAATVLLVLAGLAGGLAGVLTVVRSTSTPSRPVVTAPSMSAVRIVSPDGDVNVTLQLTFRGLKPGVPVHASIRHSDSTDGNGTDSTDGDSVDGVAVAAEAVALAGPDGVASIALVGTGISAGDDVHVRAVGGGRTCQAALGQADSDPTLTCSTH